MERRYHALRTIANVYRILGYIVLVLTILTAIAICGLSVLGSTALNNVAQQYGNTTVPTWIGGIFGGIVGSILVILYGGMVALALIAFGEGIYLLISIEENTRKTALLFENPNKLPLPAPKV